MASVRTINVGGRTYLQVVEYVNINGKRSIKVLKSFGQDNLQNRLQAEQFASSYNTFRTVAQKEIQQGNIQDFLKAAFVIFGIILGAAIISEIIDELTGSGNQAD
jgi:hypothetical protein